MNIGNLAGRRFWGASLGVVAAMGSMASAAVISNFTFTGPPWAPNPAQSNLYKQNNFATFATQAPSSDTDAFSTTSVLSNSGYTAGGYDSFYIRDVDPGTSIFSTSATPGVGMNVGGANQTVPTNYIAFSVTPDSGYQTTFESLTFYTDTNAAGDTYNMELRAWDGVVETSLGSTSNTSVGVNDPVVFRSIDFVDFTSASATEFRLYGWNVDAALGGIRYDDIVLNGTTTAIPEPSVASLIGLVGLGFLVRRRR